MSQKVTLIYGGVSPEHDVSCISARFIEDVLSSENFSVLPVYVTKQGEWHVQDHVSRDPEKYKKNPAFIGRENQKVLLMAGGHLHEPGIAFPIIHGKTGEDGCLQGIFDFLNIPYAGAGVLTSAMCMDKYYSKMLLEKANFPVVPYSRIDHSDWMSWPHQIKKELLNEFQLPLFVKPCNMGSSVGISKVHSVEAFDHAIHHALKYDAQVLVEKCIEARELEISIVGNHPNYKVTEIGEIIVHSEFYSYEAKYLENSAEFEIPAKLTSKEKNLIRDMAAAIFQLFHGDGFARIDFFLDKMSGEIYVNEINTLPGFTSISMFPKLWEHAGVPPSVLIPNLIELGFERYKSRSKLK